MRLSKIVAVILLCVFITIAYAGRTEFRTPEIERQKMPRIKALLNKIDKVQDKETRECLMSLAKIVGGIEE